MRVSARRFPGIVRLDSYQRSLLRSTPSSFSEKDGACIGCGGMLALRQASAAINFEADRAKWLNTTRIKLPEKFGGVVITQQVLDIILTDPSIKSQVGGLGVMMTEHTGCLQVVTTTQDRSAWMDTTNRCLFRSMLHNSFSDGTSNLIGLHNAYLARIISGTMPRPFYFWSFAGDGGVTIGMGQISSFFQQGFGLLLVYDNRRYANTGAQVSATSWAFENLATTPFGEAIPGNQFFPRDIIRIAAAHDVPFAATASVAYPDDLMDKVRYAINVPGPTVIWVDAPCPKEQGFGEDYTLEVAEMAVETGLFPLLRFQNDQWAIDHLRMRERIGQEMPLEEFFRMQARSEQISRLEYRRYADVLQAEVDRRYAWFLKQAEDGNVPSLYLADGEEMPVRTLEEF